VQVSYLIQPMCGGSGLKVNIFGDDNIGHCEKKAHMNTCVMLNSYRYRAVRIYKYKSLVSGNIEREITVKYILFLI